MSEEIWIHIITAVPATVAAFATLAVALKGLKKVEEVHQATNSMKDALVAAGKQVSFTEGQQDQKNNPQ